MSRWGALAGYWAGSVGANFAMWPIGSLLLYFLTETAGFSVALATVVMTAPKLWDVFFDPMIGAWADRKAALRGHRGVMLMLAAIVVPATVTLVFLLPGQSPPWLAAVAVVLLIAKSSGFMVFLISHLALADDIDHSGVARRDTVLAVRVVGQATGSLCAGAMGPLLISALGGGSTAYRSMAAMLAVPAVVGMVIVAWTARRFPTRPRPASSTGPVGLLHSLRTMLRNRAAIALIASNFCIYVSCSVVSTFMPYWNKHLLGESDSSMSILYSCNMVGMVAGSGLAAVVTRRLSRPIALLLSVALMTLATCLFLPGSNAGALMLASGTLLVWGLGLGMYSLLIFSAMMDAAAPPDGAAGAVPAGGAGILLGLLISTGKIGDSLGGVLTGSMLSWSGYSASSAPLEPVLHALRFSYSSLALVITGLSFVALLPLIRKPRIQETRPPSREGLA